MCLGGLLLLAVLAASACTTRTVPLPPPVIVSLSAPDEDGMVLVEGLCHEGASVGVLNENTQQGVVTSSPEVGCDSSCPWEVRIRADIDDELRIWQFFETESGLQQTVPVR
jgi:hypothetical protein